MIEILMYVALGFLLASLAAVLLAPPLWRRAVRLTTRRLETTMPMSLADIQADKDELRATYAIKIRQLELALEKYKDEAARNLIERNRAKVTVDRLDDEIKSLEMRLMARGNEASVLKQNVEGHIPKLEGQLAKAREAIAARDREIHKLKNAVRAHGEVVQDLAGADADMSSGGDLAALRADNERLRQALEESGNAGSEAQLRVEIRSLADRLMEAPDDSLASLAGEAPAKKKRNSKRSAAKKSGTPKERTEAGRPLDPSKPPPRRSLTERLKAMAGSAAD